MENRYITDTDFLPTDRYSYLYQLEDDRENNNQKELYQLIFGVLYHRNIDDIYHLLMILSTQQVSPILRNVKLKQWKEELLHIISNLKKYKIRTYNVLVVLPYIWRNFKVNVDEVISYYQTAIDIIDEMQRMNDMIGLQERGDFCYPLPDMRWFFWEFLVSKILPDYEGELEDLFDMNDINIHRKDMRNDGIFGIDYEVLCDEMIRRKIGGNLEKSQYYNSEEKTYRKFYIEDEIPTAEFGISSVPTQPMVMDVSDKEKTAVIYYMLRNKVDKETIIKVCNYAIGKQYNKDTHKKNTNNVERYIRLYEKDKLDADSIAIKMVEKVAKVLADYEIEMPSNVSDFLS